MTEKFKVGDKVKALGVIGTVTKVGIVKVIVDFPNGEMDYFADGRYFTDGEPCLELVERPKQKVKRTYYRAVAYYKGNALNYLYKTGYYATKELLMKENTNIVEIEEKEFEIEE